MSNSNKSPMVAAAWTKANDDVNRCYAVRNRAAERKAKASNSKEKAAQKWQGVNEHTFHAGWTDRTKDLSVASEELTNAKEELTNADVAWTKADENWKIACEIRYEAYKALTKEKPHMVGRASKLILTSNGG